MSQSVDGKLFLEQARRGSLNRRQLLHRAGALGAAAAAAGVAVKPWYVVAQETDPSGGAVSGPLLPTREEYLARLREEYQFPESPPQGGTFIIGNTTDIATTNYMLGSDDPTNPMMSLVQETLLSSSAFEGAFVPGLADSVELAEDGKTYTYHLNPTVTWHDGEPFTADDVIFSFEAQSNPDTTSNYTGTFNNTVASWTKIDDHTLEVVATEVLAPLVFMSNSYSPIVPQHIWEGVPLADWASDPGSTGQDPARVVGTGPFKFQEWVQGERLTLVRNDEYWDVVPNIAEIIYQVWPDEPAALEALRAGDLDFFQNIQASEVESIQAEESLDVEIYDTYDFGFWGLNLDTAKTTLFQDVEVRQALLYALDRQSIVDNIQLGYAEVAHGSQAKLSIAYAPDKIRTKYNFDPEKAKQLLDQAGWVPGEGGIREKDGQRLSFDLMYPTGTPATEQQVAFIQEQWAAVGIEANPNGVDFNAVLVPAITESFDYDVVLLGFSWSVDGDQSAMFSSDQYKEGFNFMKYSNPEVDRLNEEANRELDPERRVELLIESANLVNDDAPVGIISFRQDRDAYAVRWQGFHPNDYAGWQWPFQFMWTEEA
jgi:peptide/nickel transport system substrate-binding protein